MSERRWIALLYSRLANGKGWETHSHRVFPYVQGAGTLGRCPCPVGCRVRRCRSAIRKLGARADVQLLVDAGKVRLDGLGADQESGGDLPVSEATSSATLGSDGVSSVAFPLIRLSRPSLLSGLNTWLSTERTEMSNRMAVALLNKPAAASLATSSLRSLSPPATIRRERGLPKAMATAQA